VTDYAGYEIAEHERLIPTTLTLSLNVPLSNRWQAPSLADYNVEVGLLTVSGYARSTFDPPNVSLVGYPVPVFDDDYFDQILLNPAQLNLGNLLSTQTRSVEVASTYLTPRVWNGITNNIGPGSVLANLPSFPYTILPFGNYVLQLTLEALGPPAIQGDLLFDFDVVDLSLPVTGRRLVIFPFRPQSGVDETLEWATDILEAYNGDEQRMSLLDAPRQRIQYDVRTSGQDDSKLGAMLYDWLARIWGVPVWWEQQPLVNGLAAGVTEIPCDTTVGDFRVGSLVLIYENSVVFEAYEIESMTSVAITVGAPTLNTYSSQAVVLPVRQAYAKTTPQRTREQSGDALSKIEFLTLDNEDLSNVTGATTYDGKVLLDDFNYTDGSSSESWARPVVIIDNTSGRVLQSSRTDRSKITSRKRWEPLGLADVWRVRRLLHSFKGSRISFWLPTFNNDLVLVQTIGASATSIRVQDTFYTTYVQSRRPLADIRVTLVNGTVYTRRITGSEVDGTDEVLTLSASLSGSPITVAQVQRIELMMLVRIENDKAKFKHLRAGEAIVEIDVCTVKE
jgi:hypothetical protein